MDHSKEKEEENYSTQREMEVEEELLVTGEKQDGVVARAGVAGASDNNGGCGATTDGLGSGTCRAEAPRCCHLRGHPW